MVRSVLLVSSRMLVDGLGMVVVMNCFDIDVKVVFLGSI